MKKTTIAMLMLAAGLMAMSCQKGDDPGDPIPDIPANALNGVFSVQNGEGELVKQIGFSEGNLIATINESGAPTAWTFAANQFICIGEGTWRTLTIAEWQYLFNTTSRMVNGKSCYSNAISGVSIGGITFKGVFLYPDNYNGDVVSSSMT